MTDANEALSSDQRRNGIWWSSIRVTTHLAVFFGPVNEEEPRTTTHSLPRWLARIENMEHNNNDYSNNNNYRSRGDPHGVAR
jgi:hypothetical protein